MSDLQEYLAEGYEAEGAQQRERFKIKDDSGAEWALLKLSKARREYAAKVEMAEAERARIDAWLKTEAESTEHDIAFFEGVLREYHESVLAEDPKATQISLPAGKLKSRAGSRSVVVSDLETFKTWALDNAAALLRVSVEPDKRALKELPVNDEGTAITEDGEPVPGVTVIDGERSFRVELSS